MHIGMVIERLQGAGLTAKSSKCEWAKEQLICLGQKIGKGRVAVPEDRARAIAEFVRPDTKKGVRRVLGMAGYYRCFLPDYGMLATPYHAMTRKILPERVSWTWKGVQAFHSVCKLYVMHVFSQ